MISFMAATAIGVPPRVPTVEIEGTAIRLSLSLLSAAFTKPTGTPITNAGIILFDSISSQSVSRAEGAFPITIIEPES